MEFSAHRVVVSLSLFPFSPNLQHRESVKGFVSLQFLNPKDGGSARHKAVTYTNTEQSHTDIHTLSGIRTHDSSVRAGEDSSCRRHRSHCYRHRIVVVVVQYLRTSFSLETDRFGRLSCGSLPKQTLIQRIIVSIAFVRVRRRQHKINGMLLSPVTVKVSRYFRGIYLLHLQVRRVS
jgi:hypothetical protein